MVLLVCTANNHKDQSQYLLRFERDLCLIRQVQQSGRAKFVNLSILMHSSI